MSLQAKKMLKKESIVKARLFVFSLAVVVIFIVSNYAETRELKYTFFIFSFFLFFLAISALLDFLYIQKATRFAEKSILEIKEHYDFLATNRNVRKNMDDLIALDSVILKSAQFIGLTASTMPSDFIPTHPTSYSKNLNELSNRELQNIYVIHLFLENTKYDQLYLHDLSDQS